MTPVEHSALIEQARRLEAAKPQITAAAVQLFQLWDRQQREINLMYRRFVKRDPFAL